MYCTTTDHGATDNEVSTVMWRALAKGFIIRNEKMAAENVRQTMTYEILNSEMFTAAVGSPALTTHVDRQPHKIHSSY